MSLASLLSDLLGPLLTRTPVTATSISDKAPKRVADPATIEPAFMDEFETLITIVASHYGCNENELNTMREAGLNDLGGALIAYRALAAAICPSEDAVKPQLAELDRLIQDHCKRSGYDDLVSNELLSLRKHMPPAQVETEVQYFQKLIHEAEARGAAEARQHGMVVCQECSRLVTGRCTAAAEGLIAGASKTYHPVQDVFRRCHHYRSIK